jgi:NTE family protein
MEIHGFEVEARTADRATAFGAWCGDRFGGVEPVVSVLVRSMDAALAAVAEAGAFDPAAVDVFVGTSAGSVVSSRLALGHSLEAQVAEQRTPLPTESNGEAPRPRGDMTAVMEIFGELRRAETVTPEVARVVGAKAMAAPTPPEDRWIAGFDQTLGGAGAEWPAGRDLRIAALDCHSGERRMWTKGDAAIAPLATAVASSCAVPGMFPTVGIGEGRYTDGGVWSGTNADVLVGDRLDAVLLVAPTAGAAAQQPGRRNSIDVEADQLEAAGTRTVKIVPGPAFAEEIGLLNLMNPAMRGRGVEIGLADGTAAAPALQALLGA